MNATAQSPTTDQVLAALDRATQDLAQFQNQTLQLAPVEQQKAQPKIAEKHETIKRLRVMALRALKPGDVNGLTRAIGVVHAYPVFLELGIGSLPALVSCTKKQFMRVARPGPLGWGQDNPPQTDPDVVLSVERVLTSLGLGWRDPKANPKAKLPEPVLVGQFNAKERFKDDAFMGYGHPALVRGVPGKFKSIVEELKARGVYCWEDLSLHTVADLTRAGVPGVQVPVIQYEMRRRGLFFLKEEKPAIVYQDIFSVDKMVIASCQKCNFTENVDVPETVTTIPCKKCGTAIDLLLIRSDDPLSFEDRVLVKDKKTGKKIGVIDVKDDVADRVDAVDEGNDSVGEGVYMDPSENQEVEVKPDEDEGVAFPAPEAPQGVAFPPQAPAAPAEPAPAAPAQPAPPAQGAP